MKFSVMTYNLDFNSALEGSLKLIKKESPDFLCLQEINTSEKNLEKVENLGYTLIDFANSRVKWGKIFGVATFYKNPRIEPIESKGLNLPSGIFEAVEFFLKGGRLQRTILTSQCKVGKETLTIVNIHLSPYSTNSLRDKQLHSTFKELRLHEDKPVVILGDFNYPYNRSKFEEIFKKYDLSEATTSIFNTFKSKIRILPFVKFKLDYVLFKGLKHNKTERINTHYSDHVPIISTFSI